VELLGSEFGVIINDPELRGGFVAEAERSRRSANRARGGGARLRLRLANALRALAILVEPRTAEPREANRPAFAE
jgi:hypothetical protein